MFLTGLSPREGAWLATALITSENIDNPGDGITGQETVVSAAGDLNG
jgi:hypothetical protein